MRVLVTGGAGFIGSSLVRELATRGHDVIVVDNLVSTLSLRLLEPVLDRIQFFHGDVRQSDDLARLPSGPYDRVYHLAASFANELSTEHPAIDMRTNIEGTLNVLALARRTGSGLFVYTGSSSSYGEGEPPFHEDAAPRPHTPYAMTKLAAETYVRDSGLRFANFRLFNVYGPGDLPGRYRNAIPNMFKALDAPDGRIKIYGRDATRDFTYVDDVVSLLLEADRSIGELVNVGTGVERSVEDLARRMLSLLRLPEDRLTFEARRPWDRVVRRCANVGRLRERYGRVPETPLDEGLRRTARWLRDVRAISREVG
jgi:nucleoside-diphosphate-sugar epimerase